MEQGEMNNMYINIVVDNGSEKCTEKLCGNDISSCMHESFISPWSFLN